MKHTRTRNTSIRILALVGIIAVAFWLAHVVAGSEAAQRLVAQFGYVGVFVVAAVSGFNLVVPVPAVALLPVFLAGGLLFWPTVLTIALGMTIGDALGFLVGDVGRRIARPTARDRGIMARLERFRKQHTHAPLVILFLYAAFAPLPNEILVIPLAFMGYSFRSLLPIVFAGNVIFNTLAAFGITVLL